MKKYILLIIIMLLMCNITYGNKFSEIDSVELEDSKTGLTNTYQPINLILKGKDVITDVPGVLYDLDGETRTLVPVRFITEELGAKVDWDGEKQIVTINYKQKELKLTIDKKYGYVNGKKVDLPSGVPAKLMAYNDSWRTMVPVRFISENFNLDVDWIGDTRTVAINSSEQSVTGIDFKYKLKFPEIRIKTTGYVDINEYSVNSSDFGIDKKMIYSIPNVNLSYDKFEESYFLTKDNGVIKYDISLFGINDLKINKTKGDIKSTSIELDLEKKKGLNTYFDSENNEIVIQIINAVNEIYTDRIYNAEALVIGTKEDKPAFTIDKEDKKIIIDVVNSNLKLNGGKEKMIQVNHGGILDYQFYQLDTSNSSQFESDDIVTRVVMNLDESKSGEDVYIEGIDNKIYAYVSGNPLDGFEYAKVSNSLSKLDISFSDKGIYNIDIDKITNVVEISFLRDLVNIEEMELDIDDQIVEEIDISKDLDKNFIKLKLNESVKIIENSKSNELTDNIALEFTNLEIMNSKYSDKLIVVDPGHGGSDPGAIGTKTRVTESELVLRAGLMLKEKLESKGFKVYMTREKEEYVDLYQRPNIANKLNADLFVSIHINAFSSPSAQGIEVLYAEDPSRDNYSFAKIAKDYLITYLNRVDRGVKNRSRLVVLKNTTMPAILTELGFLTNPEEEKMLSSDKYLENAANAIFKSIIDQIN